MHTNSKYLQSIARFYSNEFYRQDQARYNEDVAEYEANKNKLTPSGRLDEEKYLANTIPTLAWL